MVKIGVIGAGAHSKSQHGSALKICRDERPDEVELTAICDLDREKAAAYAEMFGFGKVYESWQEMLDKEGLDGLAAITPIPVTAGLGSELLPRRLPLVIEKPPGRGRSEATELLLVAREHDSPHMVSFNRRFCPALARAREWLAENASDRPLLMAGARMCRAARREDAFPVGTAIHSVDAVLSFMGRPSQAATQKIPTSHATCFHYDMQLAFPSGAAAHLLIMPDSGMMEETYEFVGEEYRIQVDAMQCTITTHERGECVLSWSAPEDSPDAFICGAVGEAKAFIDAIRDGKTLKPGLEDGLLAIQVSEAMEAGGLVDFGA